MKYITGNKLKILTDLLKIYPLDYPITMGVLDGTFKGYAMVDSTENPKKALIVHSYLGLLHYLGSSPSPEEAFSLTNLLLSIKSERDYCNVIEFAYCPPSLIAMIEKEEQIIRKYNRISWAHDLNLFCKAPEPTINPDITVSLLKKSDFKNTFVRQECEMFWDSYETFLKKAFGTIAYNSQGDFLGVCGAVSDSDGFYEINIETTKEHRRKGVGYAIAHKYIEECYKRDYVPHWDCYDYNEPSQALAKKLGFTEAGRYPLISWAY